MEEKLFNSESKVMDALRRKGEHIATRILASEQNKKGASYESSIHDLA